MKSKCKLWIRYCTLVVSYVHAGTRCDNISSIKVLGTELNSRVLYDKQIQHQFCLGSSSCPPGVTALMVKALAILSLPSDRASCSIIRTMDLL